MPPRPWSPPSFEGAFAEEPRFIDLTWIADRSAIDRRDPRLVDAIADLAGVAARPPEGRTRRHRHPRAPACAPRLARAAAANPRGADPRRRHRRRRRRAQRPHGPAQPGDGGGRHPLTPSSGPWWHSPVTCGAPSASSRCSSWSGPEAAHHAREHGCAPGGDHRGPTTPGLPQRPPVRLGLPVAVPHPRIPPVDPRRERRGLRRDRCRRRPRRSPAGSAAPCRGVDRGHRCRRPPERGWVRGRRRWASMVLSTRRRVGCGRCRCLMERSAPPSTSVTAPTSWRVSPDGRWIVVGTVHGHLEVWPAVRPSARRTLDETDDLTSVADLFSHDGSTLTSTTRATLQYRRIGAWTIEREAPDEVADQSGGLVQLADPTCQLWLDRSGRYLLNVRRGVERLQDEATGAVRWEVPNNFVAGASATFSRDGGRSSSPGPRASSPSDRAWTATSSASRSTGSRTRPARSSATTVARSTCPPARPRWLDDGRSTAGPRSPR